MEETYQMPAPQAKWTKFFDMHSGGGTKIPPYETIYIEAPEDVAIGIFKAKFNRDPYNITCDCCGSDYSITEYDSLASATSFGRKEWFSSVQVPMTLNKYVKRKDVLVIYVTKQ